MSAEGGEALERGLPLMLRDLGSYAFMLSSDIIKRCEESMPFAPDETPYWTDSDIRAFGGLLDFIRGAHALDERMERPIHKHYRRVGQLYKLLPLTDDERQWTYTAWSHDWYRQPGDDDEMRWAETRNRNSRVAIDHQIITIGDREGVDRRDFVRRWAAWRRHRDEFTDIRPFHNAMAALSDIGFAMNPHQSALEYENDPSRGSLF